MTDSFFKTIKSDDDEMVATFDVNGASVQIGFEQSEIEDARRIAKLIQKKIKKITKSLADDIVDDVYDDIDPKPSAAQLAKRIKLRDISYNDGDAECFFNDDGLFGGNDPCVWVDDDGEIGEGHIAG